MEKLKCFYCQAIYFPFFFCFIGKFKLFVKFTLKIGYKMGTIISNLACNENCRAILLPTKYDVIKAVLNYKLLTTVSFLSDGYIINCS